MPSVAIVSMSLKPEQKFKMGATKEAKLAKMISMNTKDFNGYMTRL